MRIGVIAEGKFDQRVIRNILRGARSVATTSDVQLILPADYVDRTDRIAAGEDSFSNCELVRKACLEREYVREFFTTPLDEERWLVIHLDTDLVDKLDVERPVRPDGALKGDEFEAKLAEYSTVLRTSVVAKIVEWLEGEHADRMSFAVAVEETEAWLLAHWDQRSDGDPARHLNPKKQLDNHLNKHAGLSDKERKAFFPLKDPRSDENLSEPLRKPKNLRAAADRCASLGAFVESLPPPAE